MKKTALLIMAWLLGLTAYSQELITAKQAWDSIYPSIERQIKAPTFRDKDYRLLDYGKVSKTPGFLYTELINKVIDKCSAEGGGRVVIPKGTWFTGPITLKSNVNLHLEEGATLLFTSDLKEYPLVYTRWEGMDCYNYQPMIYAYEQENIAITGKGTIDGGAENSNWWRMCGATKYGYEFNKGIVSQRIGRPTLMEWNEKGVPLADRKMGDGYGMRVQLVNPVKCANVLIEGVTLLRSPFWVIHPLFCQNLTVKDVHIQNDGPNGDGCDPESCKNVLIEGCYFDTGDDCIAIKSGRNRDGRLAATPTENVIVRNCHMKNGHGGVVVGSEISGGFKNLFVENCVMDSPDLERVIRIKTNSCRGGVIEDIFVRNVEVGRCKEAVLKINLVYERKELCERAYPPTVRNVYLENVTCKESNYGVRMEGFEDICNIYNINVKDCDFTGVKTGGNYITGLTRDINFDNLKINGEPCLECQPMSMRMSLSELKRWPLSWQADHSQRPKWSYSVGVDMEALMAVARKNNHDAIRDYTLSYLDTLVTPEGEILTYKASDYKLDDIKNGTLLLEAYSINNDPRMLTAAKTLYDQLATQPKTKDGGYWHKRIYPNQMWLDGLYMAQPFLTSYALNHLEGKAREEALNEVANQFITVAKHTYDPATGLYRHAWNETKDMFWADKENGQSKHCWGRAQGWFFWALTDVLEKFPADHPKRPELVELLGSIADGIVKYQDHQTGVWYQVVDQSGRDKNYRESTASAMFCYNLLRGARLGLLPDSYRDAGIRAYNGILTNFIKTNQDGTVTLTDCCAVAGLGGGSSERRNGSFEYYISEPKRPNDAKGVGPFILASLEMENLN